jgi:hypothetical protein
MPHALRRRYGRHVRKDVHGLKGSHFDYRGCTVILRPAPYGSTSVLRGAIRNSRRKVIGHVEGWTTLEARESARRQIDQALREESA